MNQIIKDEYNRQVGERIADSVRDLPDGWEVQITIERGSVDVELVDPDGEAVPSRDLDRCLNHEIAEAVKFAVAEESYSRSDDQ